MATIAFAPSQVPQDTEARGSADLVEIMPSQQRPMVLEQVTSLPDSFAAPVALGTLASRALRVVEPIEVRFFRDGDHVVAEAPELDEFGYGEDQAQARGDLQKAVAELFASLRADRDRLGPDLARLLGVLERKLRDR